MSQIWLRNDALSRTTGGDTIETVRDNLPRLPIPFGLPDLTNVAEVQAACEAWYPSKLRGISLAGYEITPVDVTDREGVAGDIVFAPIGAHPVANRFKPSQRFRPR
jgi:hypothetical protein